MSMLRLAKQEEVRGFEFGVAWGYSTAWWLAHLDTGRSRWEGFDRFTGLPSDWRDLPRGYFDNAGLPPAISDARLTWHVGNVEETLPTSDLTRTDTERWIILFDLDLFEPSLAVWNAFTTHLRRGDLLYFDEAFDKDERHLLVHHILPSRGFNFVGATPLALCLEVADLLPQG